MPQNLSSDSPFSNQDKNIFAISGLPDVICGALMSRYSRASGSLRTIFEKEFSGLEGEQSAIAFYDRVLLDYGDDSIAELGGGHLACEQVSNLAAKALQDSRIGVSPLEKSSRYVQYTSNADGEYPYYVPSDNLSVPEYYNYRVEAYKKSMDFVFKTYNELIPELIEYLTKVIPKDEKTSAAAYKNAVKAKALDMLRGLLPMATLTNVGIYANGRAYEYLLAKLSSHRLEEVRYLAPVIYNELEPTLGPFIKKFKTERGQKQQTYLRNIKSPYKSKIKAAKKYKDSLNVPKTAIAEPADNRKFPSVVSTTIRNEDAEILKVVKWILIDAGVVTNTEEFVKNFYHMPNLMTWAKGIIEEHVSDRQVRQHKISRAFEVVNLSFDINLDIGSWRDLQRHRIMTQNIGNFSFNAGSKYYMPDGLPDNIACKYAEVMLELQALYSLMVNTDNSVEAQYAVPFAAETHWSISLNLREAVTFCELRSGKQGHETYRKVAIKIYEEIKKHYPNLADICFKHVDTKDYPLPRVEAEQKTQDKLNKIN